jgi:hypothetical protein
MAILFGSLIPLADSIAELRKFLIEYWNLVATHDELGGALGSLVRETEVKVAELLQTGDSWDVYEAHRLTAAFEYTRLTNS